MKIKQFEDRYLSHYSYAILSECEKKIVLIDPSRNPEQYYEFAREEQAQITGVIETHSHADFVSSHLEIHQATGAQIYASKHMQPVFPFTPFDDGDIIEIGHIKLKSLNTPGHSNDSISIVLEHNGTDKAVFTGDTLFIGDIGRPDLRETQQNAAALREELAEKMYYSLRDKLMTLHEEVTVYPAHGAGTLCGKSLSSSKSSTIGNEKIGNWALQPMTPGQFISELTSNQPFIPAYFPFDVQTNIKGAPSFEESVSHVRISETQPDEITRETWIVDTRAEDTFKQGHLPHSVNIMEGEKFETWLGTIIRPDESFYLAAGSSDQLVRMIRRSASIGYESLIKGAFVINEADEQNPVLDLDHFKAHKDDYTIIDVRNRSEVEEKKLFENSISIPLPDLRNRINEIPTSKPIVIHCAGGYRSAAASSLIASETGSPAPVYDLGEAVKQFT
ncbi:glyoxylase-like metal-dependent hydrolase (beta-lactamase superfamily II) [Arcticibacter tournemirensis]|uniref:MBL fold metallo-hydrolase n=1 Tax=Arcticibacter tournemirensis TaxID=699437 RepID=A0A5M9HBT5_9SPHI|nr:MBL fold metallo-hydrolase [Arcticibacter tournemirensis]KAA8484170.1 MBL fold metallo-hydrolase [Arcticibacter tournemirensis]TQM51916.1 glyoxylase-like metal-dependent hydrolase (beta-lactamase superfamily II) [Arcticibacter tournemirensis]